MTGGSTVQTFGGGGGSDEGHVNEQIKPDFKPNSWMCENHTAARIPGAHLKTQANLLIRRARVPSTARQTQA